MKDPMAWRSTPQGNEAYRSAREKAQRGANETGFDHGVEANDVMRTFSTFMLPQKQNRSGHELRCEVVSCESLDKCQKGHGPR
jgi:hypothetical protein